MKARILVIDDEAAIRDSLRMILEYEGYDVTHAVSGADGLEIVRREPPDLVLLDIRMPGTSGLETLGELKKVDDAIPVAMMSGHGTIADAMQATRLGAFDFIEKPFTSERVIVTVAKGLEVRELRQENRALKLAMETRYEIVGQSPAIRRVLDAVQRAAPTNATVLLLGESGVGKELVARTIHRNSTRAGQRFVQVNCAAIPEELIESELFGHEKGSFTGATEKQLGKFEQADRGTIFLDEVGDMSPKTQAKVLRVLQEHEVERLGSARTIKVDVRVVAATNKNLDEAITTGEFREDLYFRLAVIPILVPPLRERREDIPLLVQHFARRIGDEQNLRPRRFDPRVLEILQRARWRGNIRELRNTVERLLIMSSGDVIRPEDLPTPEAAERPTAVVSPRYEAAAAGIGQVTPVPAEAEEGAAPAAGPAPTGADAAGGTVPGTLREFKEVSERAFLVGKLREFGWNISRTAEALDTPRSNLYKKLEQYGIREDVDG